MSASSMRQRSGRRGHTSCDFCRTRKLRCDRPLPCTSCKTRGKTCIFEQTPTPGLTPNPPLPAAPASSPPQEDLQAEIQAFRQLAQRLEKRIQEWTTNTNQGGGAIGLSPSASTTSEGQLVGDVVAHLERVSMSQSSLDPIYSYDLVFNVDRIQAVPQAPTYTTQLGKPTPCVWLPLQAEANVLVNSYIQDLSYIQHVLHPPSLPTTIDDTYRQVGGQAHVQSGHLILLLSIIACTTHIWGPREDYDDEHSLFVSSAQANAQTPLWIKSAYAVLNAAQDSATPTLETIQGIIILSFVISNLEGVSMRYRSLISTGLLLARELGLHRIDSASNAHVATPLRVEMSRRVWWYLVATDWLLAARYGGPCEGVYQTHPRHMTVNRPLNINDVDIGPNGISAESPATEPTDMSYFLERLRLAEISRSIVDHSLMSATSLGRPSYYTQVMAMDFELDQLTKNMPPFFQLANYEHISDPSRASSIFIQAYMLNSLMHTQRCKLHITYLTSESKDNPAYLASRDICLRSAQQITRAETQLLRSRHPFVRVRLRLAAILYSIFMANIILLMDVCVHRPASLQRELINGDVAEALKILKDARSHSLAAAKLFESLMQVVARHRVQHTQLPVTQTPSASAGSPLVGLSHGPSSASSLIFNSMYSPSRHNLPTQGMEDVVSMENIEWGDLFSDVLSSSLL
ncbi:hypothetical protein GQ44DRAFT_717885 [Phaeosphaeriaceae sp. PMI808]|nr:hypothetical protein GQ44DRAFT_717885 [Phaeosphaeriaceae sp. PMI808]